MLTKLLVCLDGSASTESATRVAIAIARSHRANLLGMAVVDEPAIRAGTPTSIGGSSFKRERDDELLADARKRADDCRQLFERRCREGGVEARTVGITGRPAECLLAAMRHHDVAIMGREANFLFETDAEDADTRAKILHRATCPVLVVPDSVTEIGARVLIAFDGGSAGARAVTSFADSGLAAGREVHVATVDDNGERAWEVAKRACDILEARGVSARIRNVVTTLTTADALLRLSDQIGAGLIVMGAYARARIVEVFRTSITRAMIEKCKTAVYLHH